MLKANSRFDSLSFLSKFQYSKVTAYLILLFVAVFLGLITVVLPVQLVIAFLMIPIFLLLALKFSEYAVFLLILVLLGGIPGSYLPQMTIGGGTVRAEDLGLVFLFILLLIKNVFSIKKNKVPILLLLKPYLIPLGGLLFTAIISAVIAVLYKTAPVKDIFIEARPYLTWLLLPILFMAINSEKKLEVFKKMVLLLVMILSIIVIFQSFSGISFSDKGQELRALWTSGQGAFQSVNRSTTPGIFLIVAVFIYLISVYIFVDKPIKNTILSLLLMAVLILAILVGFARGIWLSVFLIIILLGFLKPSKRYLQFVFWMTVGAFIFIFILYLVKPDYVDAAANRLLSVSNEVKQGASLDRRFIENSYATDKIIENPFLGVGLGGHYKPPGQESITWPAEVRYIHGLYMSIAVKLGIFGLFFVLFFIVILFQRLYKVYKRNKGASTELPMIFTIFSLFIMILVLTSFTQPSLSSVSGILSIVIAIFFLEKISFDQGVVEENRDE